MLSYEIQTFKDGVWKIDSVFNECELAMFEAKRIDGGRRYTGVRLIEEKYDETTDLTTTRTLFRGGIAKGQKAKINAATAKFGQAAQRGVGKEPIPKGGARRAANKSSLVVPLLVVLVLLLSAMVILLGLQQFSPSK